MYTAEMPRKDKGFRLDIRIVEALSKVKDLTGKSSNAYVEELLMMNLKSLGIIPVDTEPLPEARGGKRSGAGKPKRSPIDDKSDDSLTEATAKNTEIVS